MHRYLLPGLLVVAGILLIGVPFVMAPRGASELTTKIEHAPFLMPAAHRVYTNPEVHDGRYFLFKTLITNKGGRTARDVTVSYRVPQYIDWTEVESADLLLPGQSLVAVAYPDFEDAIMEKRSASRERVEIRVTSAGGDEIEESFAFDLRGRNDYVYTSIPADEQVSYQDLYDNSELLAAFVTPNDPVVQYYTQQIQEKVLQGETASVTREAKEGVRFLTGIYEATLRAGMVYSGTKGVPAQLGDVSSLIQSIRLPREVVTGNTGLCIELSTLYASVLSAAGLDPIIFLVPGHAYPGFRLNGQYFAIESTGIGGAGLGSIMTAEQALEAGMKQLNEFLQKALAGDPRYTIVDVHALNAEGIVPAELADDTFLREKVDEIAERWTTGRQQPQIAATRQPQGSSPPSSGQRSSGGGQPNVPSGSGMATYAGPVSFQHPPTFTRLDQPLPQLPFLVTQLEAPDQTVGVSVYHFPGVGDTGTAMRYIQQALGSMGYQVTLQPGGSAGGYDQVAGQTQGPYGMFAWHGRFTVTPNGVVGVTAGAPQAAFAQRQSLIQSILSSVR